MNETCKLDMEPQTIEDYHVTFLSLHPSGNHLFDDTSRWWSLWYEYVLDTNNIPVYGARILLGPNRKPNTKNYILWIDSVHLFDPSCYIHCPFNFDFCSDIIKPNQYIIYLIGNFFSLLVLLSVLFHLFSLVSLFLKFLKFQKLNGTRPSAHDRIYTTSILVLLFIVKKDMS